MRGRRPTPTYLKILRGNPGCRPLPEHEIEPTISPVIPDPPTFLEGYAREEWFRIAEELLRLKLLTLVDINPLAAYCQAYARWRTAEEALATMARRDSILGGLMIKTRNGSPIQNPLVTTARGAANDMVRYASEFGLTPSARARIAAGPSGPRGPNKFDGLIG